MKGKERRKGGDRALRDDNVINYMKIIENVTDLVVLRQFPLVLLIRMCLKQDKLLGVVEGKVMSNVLF